jgi:hypothetical protein
MLVLGKGSERRRDRWLEGLLGRESAGHEKMQDAGDLPGSWYLDGDGSCGG